MSTKNGLPGNEELGNESTGNGLPELRLYVKAGRDGADYGACPFCQRIFMICLVGTKRGLFSFTIKTVNQSKPIQEFREVSSVLPTLVVGDDVYKDVDEIVGYFDRTYSGRTDLGLRYNNQTADIACMNIFSKFNFFIKDVAKDSSQLLAELRKVDSYLEDEETLFMTDDTISHLDCMILPKLHHIRVAANAFKEFEIPKELIYLWNYLGRAYQHQIFTSSCPTDQEIVFTWSQQPKVGRLTMQKRREMEKRKPKYSFAIPNLTINNNNDNIPNNNDNIHNKNDNIHNNSKEIRKDQE